jgi:hypothetical protein
MKSASPLDRFLASLQAAPLFGLGRQFAADRELLVAAEVFAADRQFDRALDIAKNLIISLREPVAFWQQPWRQWQVRALFDKLDPQVIYWRRVIADYQQALVSAKRIAADSDFDRAESLLYETLEVYPHRQGAALLKEVQRLRQGQEWFRLGLAAEMTGEIAAARYHYNNIRNEFPNLQVACRRRLTALALAERNWTVAIEHSNYLTDRLSLQYHGLAHYQRSQERRLQILRHIQQDLQAAKLEEAWQSSVNYIEELGSDDLIQQVINEYIQPQLTAVPSDWAGRFQLAQSRWLKAGGKTTLHDWAIAAYYRFLTAPDRLDWLQELLPIWVTASINTNLELPKSSKLPEAETIAVKIRDLLSNLIDQISDETDRAQLRLQWQREMTALEYLGSPPTSGLRIHGAFLTPGFYDLFQAQIKAIELPEKPWAMFYTPWWRSVLACLAGNPIQAMQAKPTISGDTESLDAKSLDSVASRFAEQFVAYHEGCYYLLCKPGGFPRWREAFSMLELAQDQILKSSAWRSNVDQLCDDHHPLIWSVADRKEFADRWYRLLHSSMALDLVNAVAYEVDDK